MSLIERGVSEPLFHLISDNTIGGVNIMGKIIVYCENCNVELERYPSQVLNTIFCSKKCRSEYFKKNHSTELLCVQCGKRYRKRNANIGTGRQFCSKECKDSWQKEGLKRESNPFFGKRHSSNTKEKISESRTGKLLGEENPKYNKVSVQCQVCGKQVLKIPYLVERNEHQFCSVECHAKWRSSSMVGESNFNWNPELSEEERKFKRRIKGYTSFKGQVLRRDNHTCQKCGRDDAETELVVHHLNSYDWDKKNRVNVDNGITLCIGCHKDFHDIYGYGKNTKQQFYEYMKKRTV